MLYFSHYVQLLLAVCTYVLLYCICVCSPADDIFMTDAIDQGILFDVLRQAEGFSVDDTFYLFTG